MVDAPTVTASNNAQRERVHEVPHGEPSEDPCVAWVLRSVLDMTACHGVLACHVRCSKRSAAATCRRSNRRVMTLEDVVLASSGDRASVHHLVHCTRSCA